MAMARKVKRFMVAMAQAVLLLKSSTVGRALSSPQGGRQSS